MANTVKMTKKIRFSLTHLTSGQKFVSDLMEYKNGYVHDPIIRAIKAETCCNITFPINGIDTFFPSDILKMCIFSHEFVEAN